MKAHFVANSILKKKMRCYFFKFSSGHQKEAACPCKVDPIFVFERVLKALRRINWC